jgi:hypothetical protein
MVVVGIVVVDMRTSLSVLSTGVGRRRNRSEGQR